MTTKLLISNAAHIAAAQVCVSKESTRYYLNGIHFETAPQGGVLIVSTDGHRMSLAHDPDGYVVSDNQSLIIRFERDILKHCKPGNILEYADGKATVSRKFGDDAEQIAIGMATEIDGTFPAWQKCLPLDGPKCTNAGFNSGYLADFHKIAKAYSGMARSLQVLGTDAEMSHWVAISGLDVEWRGVLMPFKASFDKLDRPDWIDAKPAAEPAEAHAIDDCDCGAAADDIRLRDAASELLDALKVLRAMSGSTTHTYNQLWVAQVQADNAIEAAEERVS